MKQKSRQTGTERYHHNTRIKKKGISGDGTRGDDPPRSAYALGGLAPYKKKKKETNKQKKNIRKKNRMGGVQGMTLNKGQKRELSEAWP